MKRNLFLLEVRRALIPAAAVVLAGLAVLALIERAVLLRGGQNGDTARQGIDLLLLGGIAVSGLFAGGRVFSRDFKEHHGPFLAMQPLSRSWAWAILMAAGLTASVAAGAVAVALRPSLVVEPMAPLLGVAAGAHLYGFVVGACLALAFGRWLFVPVVGYPVAAAILWETVSLALDQGSDALRPRLAAPGAALSFLTFVGASYAMFLRGEFDLPRVRRRSLGGLGLVLILLVVTLRWAYPAPILGTGFPSKEFLVAPDGRFVARGERLASGRVAVTLASLGTGERLGRWSGADADAMWWAPEADALWIAAMDEPFFRASLLLSPRRSRVALVGVDGRERARHDVGDRAVHHLTPLDGNRAFVVVADDASTRLLLVGDGAAPRVLLDAGPARSTLIWETSRGPLVTLGTERRTRVFMFRDGTLVEFDVVEPRAEHPITHPILIGGQAFVTVDQARDELERLHPSPEGAAGRHVVDRYLGDDAAVYFVRPSGPRHVDLFALEKARGTWHEVARGAILEREPEGSNPDFTFAVQVTSMAFDCTRGIAVYQRPTAAGYEVVLHDAALGRSFVLAGAQTEIDRLIIMPTSWGDLIAIRAGSSGARSWFSYPGDGSDPRRLPPAGEPGAGRLLDVRPDGSLVVLRGEDVFVVDRGASERRINW